MYYLEKDSPIWNEITLFNKAYDKSEGKFKKEYTFMDKSSNYFIEIGGVGSGATADKVVGNPIYANGLMINVGYRYVFK